MARRRSRSGRRRAIATLTVLLIDDAAPTLLPVLSQGLQSHGFEVLCEAEPKKALEAIASSQPHVVLLDLHFPGDSVSTTGARLLTEIRKQFPSLPVVVFTSRLDDVTIPVESFDETPHGYIAKPKFGRDRDWPLTLSQALRDAIDAVRYANEVSSENLGFFVGQTKDMCDVAAQMRIAARNSLPVVIFGESGTGKKMVAEAIHRLSRRAGRFEHWRCSGTDGKTLHLTLFGHNDLISGLKESAPGLLVLAHEGTLFLDSIQKVPEELQRKLVTFIESRSFRSTDTGKKQQLNVRLIVSTNHSLADLVAEGTLREDLAYRLQGTIIALPPLRTRRADLPGLFELFVAKANKATKRHVLPTLRPETIAKLDQHSWPGNIRELEATILRAVAHTSANVLLPDDIEFAPLAPPAPAMPSVPSSASVEANGPNLIVSLTNQLESQALSERYEFLKGLGEAWRKPVLEEFVGRLRKKLGRRIGHKDLAAALAPATGQHLDTIRQFIVSSCNVKLTQLESNQ